MEQALKKNVSFFEALFYLNLVFSIDAWHKDPTLVAAHPAIIDSSGDVDLKDVSAERICRKREL